MQNNIAVNHGFYLDMILKFEPLLKKSLLSFEETVDPPIVELISDSQRYPSNHWLITDDGVIWHAEAFVIVDNGCFIV